MMIFWLSIIGMTVIAVGFLVIPYVQYARQHAITLHFSQQIGIFLFISAFFSAAVGSYLHWGASQSVAEMQRMKAEKTALDAEIIKLGSVKNIIVTLKQRVVENPDARGWFLLGRLYLRDQQFSLAVKSFAEANRLAPNQLDTLVAYAEALYFFHHQELTADAKELLAKALAINPKQIDALTLLAADAYQHKNYSQAIYYWEQLLPLFSPNSEAAKKILEMIANAQKRASR